MTTVHFIVTCDGGSRGNGTPTSEGYGSFLIQLLDQSDSIMSGRDYGTGVTSNEAEYMSLIDALEHIFTAFTSVAGDLKTIELTIRMDSALVVGQMSLGHRIKAPNLQPLAIRARNLLNQFNKTTFEKISGDEMKEILGH